MVFQIETCPHRSETKRATQSASPLIRVPCVQSKQVQSAETFPRSATVPQRLAWPRVRTQPVGPQRSDATWRSRETLTLLNCAGRKWNDLTNYRPSVTQSGWPPVLLSATGVSSALTNSLNHCPKDVSEMPRRARLQSGLESRPRCFLGGWECAEPLTSLPALAWLPFAPGVVVHTCSRVNPQVHDSYPRYNIPTRWKLQWIYDLGMFFFQGKTFRVF